MITEVANSPVYRYTRSPIEMVKELQRRYSEPLQYLSPQTLGRMFELQGGRREFKPRVLELAAKNNIFAPSQTTRWVSWYVILYICTLSLSYVLFNQAPYPTLVDEIKHTLQNLRAAKVALTTSTIRAIIIASINSQCPRLFHQGVW